MTLTRLAAAAATVGILVGGAACDGSDAQTTAGAPAALFVVGDSLSDTGNAAAVADFLLGQPMHPDATIGLCHPFERFALDRDCTDILYARSRVSDGPVAVEHLAAHLGVEPFDPSFHTVPDRPVVGTNYAVAGAKARGTSPRDLGHQVDRLLLDHGPLLPAGAAVVLMIGGNDAIDALQAAALPSLENPSTGFPSLEDPTAAPAEPASDPSGTAEPGSSPIVVEAVDAIVAAATRLLDSGACVIVANVPDLGWLPGVRSTAESEGLDVAAAVDTARDVAIGFNGRLGESLASLAATHPRGASLVQFDLAAGFDAAVEAAELAGLNVVDACFDSEGYIQSATGERRFHPECAPEPEGALGFDRFFFWDAIHPTRTAHAELGAALIDAYERSCRALAQ